jgi:hypothetical protein
MLYYFFFREMGSGLAMMNGNAPPCEERINEAAAQAFVRYR